MRIGLHPRVINRHLAMFPAWSHPEVTYWAPIWAQIRDCVLGEQEIKAQGETYLPRLNKMDNTEYDAYRDMAVFFNMTDRTINAMVGTLFQRKPKITGVPARLADKFKTCVHKNIPFHSFLADIAEGLLTTGGYGLLLDMDSEGRFPPYILGFDRENILDWREDEVEGRTELVQVVLREFLDKPQDIRTIGVQRDWVVRYRVLSLEGSDAAGWRYVQHIYDAEDINTDLSTLAATSVTPTNRGVPFTRIPFRVVGAKTNTPSCDRPPLAGIAALNLAHYRAYAILEHGRFFTGMPVWYVQRQNSSEAGEYYLGSAMIWECAVGEKPGIIEFNGTGLKSLENSCAQKEEQIAMLGGRLMGGGARSISESDNQAKLKEGNERSLLLQIALNINDAVTELVNLWCSWQDERNPQVQVELNTDFLTDMLGARELRAAQQMYADGIIPIEALHNYLLKAEVVPEWMEIDEFKRLLKSVESFPNQPDVWARMMGYASNKERIDEMLKERDLANQEELTEVEWAKIDIALKQLQGEMEAATADDPAAQADPEANALAIRQQVEAERQNLVKEALEARRQTEVERHNRATERQAKLSSQVAAARNKLAANKPAPAARPTGKPAPQKPIAK